MYIQVGWIREIGTIFDVATDDNHNNTIMFESCADV